MLQGFVDRVAVGCRVYGVGSVSYRKLHADFTEGNGEGIVADRLPKSSAVGLSCELVPA